MYNRKNFFRVNKDQQTFAGSLFPDLIIIAPAGQIFRQSPHLTHLPGNISKGR
jgi:hypothetical protein